MKKLSLLFFVLMYGSIANAQPFKIKNLDYVFQQEYTKLKEQHIDTVIIYHRFCEGIMHENKDSPSRCYGFREGFILWKSKGQCFIKRVVCYGETSDKIVKISSKPFDAYFTHLQIIRRMEKYKDNAVDILPRAEDECIEQLFLLNPKIKYQIRIGEVEKESKGWKKFSWIRSIIKVLEITRTEIDQAIAAGLPISSSQLP